MKEGSVGKGLFSNTGIFESQEPLFKPQNELFAKNKKEIFSSPNSNLFELKEGSVGKGLFSNLNNQVNSSLSKFVNDTADRKLNLSTFEQKAEMAGPFGINLGKTTQVKTILFENSVDKIKNNFDNSLHIIDSLLQIKDQGIKKMLVLIFL